MTVECALILITGSELQMFLLYCAYRKCKNDHQVLSTTKERQIVSAEKWTITDEWLKSMTTPFN